MYSLKKALAQFIRSPVNPRPVHRLKLNTLLRLTFILTLGGAGLTACANLQQEQTAHKQENEVTVSFAERMKTRAEQGDTLGQAGLGLMYQEGRGVPQDDQLAVQWLRKAAEQGDTYGQNHLGLMYAEGRGVPKNYVYAYMWLNIAASGDFEGLPVEVKEVMKGIMKRVIGETQKALEKEMTPSQIQKAKELARACIRKQYKGCEV